MVWFHFTGYIHLCLVDELVLRCCFEYFADIFRNDWKCYDRCAINWKILSLYVCYFKVTEYLVVKISPYSFLCLSLSPLLSLCSLFSSYARNLTKNICVCSCAAYGACSFTYYTRMCFANPSKHYNYWWRGTFNFIDITIEYMSPKLCSLDAISWNDYVDISTTHNIKWNCHKLTASNWFMGNTTLKSSFGFSIPA